MNLKISSSASLFIAAITVVSLNFIILLGVYSSNADAFKTIIDSFFISVAIYLFVLFICIISLLLKDKRIIRITFFTLLSLMTLHIFYNLYQLILTSGSNTNQNGSAILFDALLIWSSSVVTFSIWYWLLDRQSSIGHKIESEDIKRDFLFPQNQTSHGAPAGWKPTYFDYLSLSFFTSTSFAPSDTLPMTKRARLLMMIEASISLVIIGMVAARAISIIK
jgi:hypothetical protein